MLKKSITSLYKFISFIRRDRPLAWVLWLLACGESCSQVLIQLHADRNWVVFPFKALLCGPLPSLVRFKQPEHATRPNPSFFSLSPKTHTHTHAHSYTHASTHLDRRRCVTNGNALPFDELIFSLLMLTGHTHTQKHTQRRHSLTPFYVALECSSLILEPNPVSEQAADPWGPRSLGFEALRLGPEIIQPD